MALEQFSLATLAEMDGGRIRTAFEQAAREREELNKAKNDLIDERDAARRALAALVQAIKSATLEGLCGLHRTEVFAAAEKAAGGVS